LPPPAWVDFHGENLFEHQPPRMRWHASSSASFAQKADVEIEQDSVVHLHTANGIVEGKRGRAIKIQLRSLVAKDVPVVINSTGAYGEGIDGLLGMSFLSRFNIKIDTKLVNISTRH
jgi:predicted aspartyl protease